MPIIKSVPQACRHPGKPSTDHYGEGTVWQCDNDNCQVKFMLEYDWRERNRFWRMIYEG